MSNFRVWSANIGKAKVRKLILVTWPIKYNVIILGIAIIFLGYYPTCLTVNFVWRRNEEIIKSINIIK